MEIVRDLCGDQARILEGIRRGSPQATFEAALRECRGDVVFLSDQDDAWLPGKVDMCCRALSSSTRLEEPPQGVSRPLRDPVLGGAPLVPRAPCLPPMLALHDARMIDADGRILSESFLRSRGRHDGFWRNLWKPSYLGCAVAFRRELLELALPFPDRVPMHDWWLGLLAERTGGVVVLDRALILHRRHGRNANFDPNRSPYGPLERLGFRWRIWRDVRRRLAERA